MTTRHNSARQKRDLSLHSEGWWRQPLLLGVIGVSLLVLVMPRAKGHPPAAKPGDPVVRHAPTGANPSGSPQRPASLGSLDARGARGQSFPALGPVAVGPTGPPREPPPPPPAQQVWEPDAPVAQVKTPTGIKGQGATAP